jgi:signal transduction histidine kinase
MFNSSDKRLARVLLMLARFGKEGTPETVLPRISQESLAEMVGTTRSRVSFFHEPLQEIGIHSLQRWVASPQLTSQHCSPRLTLVSVDLIAVRPRQNAVRNAQDSTIPVACLRLSHAHSELEALAAERTAELQKLTQRQLKVQHNERRQLARDLHDSTGQTLTALKMSASLLQQNCKQAPAALAIASDVVQLADQAVEEIRTMSYLLHPPLLEVGFACAAEWYIEGYAKRSGINVRANIGNSRERLPQSVEIALFRVLQESLTNIHRHSGASDATVHFQHEVDAVILEIHDFGRGIPEERLRLLHGGTAESGVGLAGMRERLHELDGTLEMESDGRGTSLRATVPLYAPGLSAQLGACGEVSAYTYA